MMEDWWTASFDCTAPFPQTIGGSGPGAPSDLPDAGATLIAILLLLLGLWVAIWSAIASLALLYSPSLVRRGPPPRMLVLFHASTRRTFTPVRRGVGLR
jgi:hypothetical protein